MTNVPKPNKKLVRELEAKLKGLQAKLADAHKREGKDPYLDVKVKKNQSRSVRVRQKGVADTATGKFYLEVAITAKQGDVFVPVSVASGKKVAGFMYQIEGTAPGSLASTELKVRGEGVTHVTLGTLRYAKIGAGKTALFLLQATIRGSFGKTYQFVIVRLNYKLDVHEARYQQYLKELRSDKVTLS